MTYWNAVCILLSDSLSFGLAFLELVLVLELGTHDDGLVWLEFGIWCKSAVLYGFNNVLEGD